MTRYVLPDHEIFLYWNHLFYILRQYHYSPTACYYDTSTSEIYLLSLCIKLPELNQENTITISKAIQDIEGYGECPGGALEFSVTGLCPSKNFSSPNEGIFRVNRHPIGEFFIGNDTQSGIFFYFSLVLFVTIT